MPKPKVKPTDQEFETLLYEVFRDHPGIELLENYCLIAEAEEKMENRYSRRVIRKYDIHLAVMAAVERLRTSGRLQAFNVLGLGGHYNQYLTSATVYGLRYDRQDVMDPPALDA